MAYDAAAGALYVGLTTGVVKIYNFIEDAAKDPRKRFAVRPCPPAPCGRICLTTKGYDHNTRIRTSFDARCGRISLSQEISARCAAVEATRGGVRGHDCACLEVVEPNPGALVCSRRGHQRWRARA